MEPTDHIMQFFDYTHLPAKLQDVARPFCDLAKAIVDPMGANFGVLLGFFAVPALVVWRARHEPVAHAGAR